METGNFNDQYKSPSRHAEVDSRSLIQRASQRDTFLSSFTTILNVPFCFPVLLLHVESYPDFNLLWRFFKWRKCCVQPQQSQCNQSKCQFHTYPPPPLQAKHVPTLWSFVPETLHRFLSFLRLQGITSSQRDRKWDWGFCDGFSKDHTQLKTWVV